MSFVLCNPVNLNDPSGHTACWDEHASDPECQNVKPTANGLIGKQQYDDNAAPIIAAYVPKNMDLEKATSKNPKSNNPTTSLGNNDSNEPKCPSCIITGGAILFFMLPIEGVLLAATILAGPTVFLEAALLPTDAMALNISLIGIELISKGQNSSKEDINMDYLPLLHLFDPNTWK